MVTVRRDSRGGDGQDLRACCDKDMGPCLRPCAVTEGMGGLVTRDSSTSTRKIEVGIERYLLLSNAGRVNT